MSITIGLFGGGVMSKKQLMPRMALGILFAALPAWSQNQAPREVQLPEGNGKDAVEAVCSVCHTLERVVNSGYTRAGWANTISMMKNNGAPLPKDQFDAVVEYLAKNFPEKPSPSPVLVPGSVEATIKEWQVPTPGSRPHDPLVAPDGSIWYAGQMANVLGHFDPKTAQFKEYHVKSAQSGPHGLVADHDGNIWFTANFKGYIGKLNPKTGEFTEYPMPDPKARDPHTPLFDQKGTLWFTVQGANMVGRLDPETGQVKVVSSPTPRSQPYGMVVNSKGVPFFAEFGTNKIASIDPNTMEIHEYVLPNPGTRPRRIAITADDVIWYGDYSRGYLGRYDPKTGQASEWPSPGGSRSMPYGITAVKGILWYSESGTRPNTVVRFDPATEKFQTWVIPSGGGVVRNMMADRDGNLWLACIGVNGIAEVAVKMSDKSPAESK
jgi:virginiamycin B lyase